LNIYAKVQFFSDKKKKNAGKMLNSIKKGWKRMGAPSMNFDWMAFFCTFALQKKY